MTSASVGEVPANKVMMFSKVGTKSMKLAGETMRRLSYLMLLSMVAVLVTEPVAFAQTENLSCADFATQAGAQAVYKQNLAVFSELDADNDGKACKNQDRLLAIIAGASLGDLVQVLAATIAILNPLRN